MQTSKPFPNFPAFLKNFYHLSGKNLHELASWFDNVFRKQDSEVIERSAKTFRWHFKEILLSILLGFLFAKVDKVQHFFTSFAIDIQQDQYPFWLLTLLFCFHGMFVIWLSYVFWHKPKKVRGWVNSWFGNRRDRSYEIHYNLPNGYWWVAVIATLPVLMVNVALSISLVKDYGYAPETTAKLAEDFTEFVSEQTVRIFIIAVPIFLFLCILTKPSMRNNVSLSLLTGVFKKRLLTFITTILLFVFLFKVFSWQTASVGTWYILIVSRCLLLLGFIFIPTLQLTHFWYITSKCLHHENELAQRTLKETGKFPFKKMDEHFDRLRYFSYSFSFFLFVILNQSFLSVQSWFPLVLTPVPVLLFVFIFYYQLWDFIYHNVTRIRRNAAFAVLLLSLILFGQKQHYQIKFNGDQEAIYPVRTDIRNFFAHWAYRRFQIDSMQENPVFYLVAAEGGGSRSGAWTAAVLTELDAKMNGTFRRNCFAISSVSGGSIGSAATLALWDNARRKNFNGTVTDSLYKYPADNDKHNRVDRADGQYISRVFRRNYVSSAIAGIFFYDFWQSVPIVNWFYVNKKSRTDRQQDEENDAICNALKQMPGFESGEYSHYFNKIGFLNLYYGKDVDNSFRPVVDLPLFFPNTTRVEDGRRGIVSPVLMNFNNANLNAATIPPNQTTPGTTGENAHVNTAKAKNQVFVSAVDVIGLAAKEEKSGAFSLAEAAGLSQIFPYVNSNVRVGEKTGRFMDGGAYENMGLTTLYEVRNALYNVCVDQCFGNNEINLKEVLRLNDIEHKRFIEYLKRVKFKFVLIYNIDDHVNDDNIEKKNSSQLLDPITALLKTPFSGHTDYIYHKLKIETPDSMIIEFPLSRKTETSQYQQDIVMSRWLSRYEMERILNRSDSLVRQNLPRMGQNR